MVVAIYYFLNRATIALKVFSFFAYYIGMAVLLGEMLVETNVKLGAIEALRALPAEQLSRPTVHYLAVDSSWISAATRITFNLSFWILWCGPLYLLFLWKQRPATGDSAR